jgi:hypothetical protein
MLDSLFGLRDHHPSVGAMTDVGEWLRDLGRGQDEPHSGRTR